jgi:2-hydroxychromene-2-carboxylate isomerase
MMPRIEGMFAGDVKVSLKFTVSPDAPGLGPLERRYYRRDAACVAPALGLEFPEFSVNGKDLEQPSEAVLEAASRVMAWAETRVEAGKMEVEDALVIGKCVGSSLWSHASDSDRVAALLALADQLPTVQQAEFISDNNAGARINASGYDGLYINAMGVWYGGMDRYQYLVADLARLTGRPLDLSPILPKPELLRLPNLPRTANKKIVIYASFRSPYSAVLLQHLSTILSKHPHWQWELKPVPPMVTRGVALTTGKRRYFAFDCGRVNRGWTSEAFAQPYMKICDPLESWGRAAAVYHYLFWHADGDRKQRAMKWMVCATRAAFFEGREYGTEAGLKSVAASCGISADEVDKALTAQDHDIWRAELKKSVKKMESRGVWGVPSIAIETDGTRSEQAAWWGQDRRWVAEEMIRRIDGVSSKL